MATNTMVASNSQTRYSILPKHHAQAQMQTQRKPRRIRDITNPPRFYVQDEVSPSVSPEPQEDNLPLPSKRKAYMKWMGNIVGDTVSATWSGSTFQRPREGKDYH